MYGWLSLSLFECIIGLTVDVRLSHEQQGRYEVSVIFAILFVTVIDTTY